MTSKHPSGAGDHILNPDLFADITQFQDHLVQGHPGLGSLRTASVLIALRRKDGETSVLFTRRTEHLNTHASQISFPGGKREEKDSTFLQTALREAEEEIGLPTDNVEPLGFLDVYQTFSGYRITPLLAIIPDDFEAKPDPGEVAEVFEVPLSFLMHPDNHQLHSKIWHNKQRFYHAITYEKYYIWGITAGILHNFYERLYR